MSLFLCTLAWFRWVSFLVPLMCLFIRTFSYPFFSLVSAYLSGFITYFTRLRLGVLISMMYRSLYIICVFQGVFGPSKLILGMDEALAEPRSLLELLWGVCWAEAKLVRVTLDTQASHIRYSGVWHHKIIRVFSLILLFDFLDTDVDSDSCESHYILGWVYLETWASELPYSSEFALLLNDWFCSLWSYFIYFMCTPIMFLGLVGINLGYYMYFVGGEMCT